MKAIRVRFNDVRLTATGHDSLSRVLTRMDAATASLYTTSTGIRAFVVDQGGGEHLGVFIAPLSEQADHEPPEGRDEGVAA